MAVDPTGTERIRARYERDMIRRFRRLRTLIRQAIIKDNVFGLRTGDQAFGERLNPGAFEFTRSDSKVAEFDIWLRERVDAGILEVKEGVPLKVSAQEGWQNKYIDTARRKGTRDAIIEARGERPSDADVQAVLLAPTHVERAGLAYTRNLEGLKGITAVMSKQIRGVLAEGLAEGEGPRVIARNITDRVNKVGITRARTLARTEVIASHADATLTTFEGEGIEGVRNEAEFQTAGDGRVCVECAALEGNVYLLEEARGIIPVHPNCRCRWLPVIPEDFR